MRHQKSRHGCCHSSPSGQELVVLAADPGNIGMQKGDQERKVILVEVLYRMKRSKVNELHLLWFHRSTSVCGLNARFLFCLHNSKISEKENRPYYYHNYNLLSFT